MEHHTRILLADDYADAIDMWALYLRLRGYDVLTASDGVTALDLASTEHPDLVILDLDLPGMTGLEVARRLRHMPHTSAIPLVAVTGYSHAKQLDAAREAGFDKVLVKPCEPQVLVQELEQVLAEAKPGLPSAG